MWVPIQVKGAELDRSSGVRVRTPSPHTCDVILVSAVACFRLEKEYNALKTKEQEDQVELRVSTSTSIRLGPKNSLNYKGTKQTEVKKKN